MKIKYLNTEIFSFTYNRLNGKMKSMDTQIAIYALIDPRTKLPFYVGKTNKPQIRLKGHRSGRGTTPTAKFIREIRAAGYRPDMKVLELCDEKYWQDREAYWIERYQSEFGMTQVLNVMEGGCQVGRFMNHSEATKERLRQMFKGRPIPQEVREQISKSLTGLKQSDETVQKRLTTINEHRAETGLEPHKSWASYEEYRSAGRAAYNVTRTRQRRERGALIRGSEEWKRNAAEKSRAHYDSLDDEQKKAFASQRRGKPGANKGRKFGPLSLEQRAKLSAIHKQRLAVLTPEQRLARTAAARKAQPEAWKAIIASKTKDERKAMMTAANAANKTSPWQGG
jgi:GIY-YIG catalytic domain